MAESIDRGWSWVVLLSAFLSITIIGGFGYGVGEIYTALLERYQASVVSTAVVGSLHTALCTSAGLLSSLIIDTISCRCALITSGVLLTIGCLATAFAPTIDVCIFTFGVIAGTGGGIGYTAGILVIGFNFERRRNVALGIAVAGVGGGLFLIPPTIQILKQIYGNASMFIVLAGLPLQMVFLGALCRPSRLELEAQRIRRAASIGESSFSEKFFKHLRQYLAVSTDKRVLCVYCSIFSYCTGLLMVFLYLPAYTLSKGYSGMTASLLMSASGIATIVGRVLVGLASNCDHIDDLHLFSGGMVATGLVTSLFPLYSDTFAGQVAYYLLLGTYSGSGFVLLGSIVIPIVGIEYTSIVVGIAMMFGGIGSVIGTPASGNILDRWSSYEIVFQLAGFLLLIAAASGLATKMFEQERANKYEKEDKNVEMKLLDLQKPTPTSTEDLEIEVLNTATRDMHEPPKSTHINVHCAIGQLSDE